MQCVVNTFKKLSPYKQKGEVTIMYIVDGIAYASNETDIIEVQSVKPLDDLMMILTFTSGEKRLYDATILLQYPAFAPLANQDVFMDAKIEDGVVTWCNGEIDIAPETMYRDSYPYSSVDKKMMGALRHKLKNECLTSHFTD